MAGNYRSIAAFLRHALLGTLAGVLIGVVAGIVLEIRGSPRFEATVVLFHTPGSGLSDSGRDFIAATLAYPEFLPAVATEQGWDAVTAAGLARRIVVAAPDASRPIAEIRLKGTDEAALAPTLDAVAEQMVALHRERQKEALQWQLDELDEALETALARRLELERVPPDRATLPAAANDAIAAAANLERQRREIELGKRFRLRLGSELHERRRELSLKGLVRQLERAQQKLDEHGAVAGSLVEQARAVAIADAEILALRHIRDGLTREFDSFRPLQIVRPAEVAPLAADASPSRLLAAFGGLIGLLGGGLAWSRKQTKPDRLGAAVVEKSLRVPVLAVVPENLSDAADRLPLAETNPQHLAIAAIHSLRVALQVRVSDPAVPVVITGLDDPHRASLVVANLAVLAAQGGERVQIVDEIDDHSVLRLMFPDDATPDPVAVSRFGSGSIRLVRDGDAAGSIANAAGTNFDRTFVHVRDATRARAFIRDRGAGIAVIVCGCEQPLSALRKAQANKLFGVVLAGYPIDEPEYRGQDPVPAN